MVEKWGRLHDYSKDGYLTKIAMQSNVEGIFVFIEKPVQWVTGCFIQFILIYTYKHERHSLEIFPYEISKTKSLSKLSACR